MICAFNSTLEVVPARWNDTGAKDRGSFVTLMSKDIVNKVVDALRKVIEYKCKWDMFSFQIYITNRCQQTRTVCYCPKICDRHHSWALYCCGGLWKIYKEVFHRGSETNLRLNQYSYLHVWATPLMVLPICRNNIMGSLNFSLRSLLRWSTSGVMNNSQSCINRHNR